ncbi:hypothetical protein SAMN05660420_02145 [Desulfuromusa kysingii]|uniref:Phospholipase_D-nuclease N-terminal n=1 Tax=Desulfuromusa kysingii TaxID=37625 RepID=A0A1H4BDI4_9BACT|nr:hypothetical protein [Desulfuromusa kysingii]SEA46058.1 hypothetical protein SAMN05660420_02145 [Desulfuromusa kysingii]
MPLILMLIVFACAAYSVASTKGRNRYLWFCLGFILGPFAVLILALMSIKPGEDKKID